MARVVATNGKKIPKNEPIDVTPFTKAAKKVGQVEMPKKAAKLNSSAPPVPRVDEGKAFSKEELAQLEVLQLRMTTTQQTIELLNRNLEAFIRDAQDKIKAAQTEVGNKQMEAQRRAEELMSLYTKLEAKYEVKMRDITYDPASGKIMTAPPGMLDSAAKR